MDMESQASNQAPVAAQPPMQIQKIKFGELLNEAWEIASKKIWRLLGIEIVLIIITILALICYVILSGVVLGLVYLLGVPALLIFIAGVLLLGFIGVCLWFTAWKLAAVYKYLSGGEDQTVLPLLDAARPVARVILPTVVLGVLAILGGYIAFVIPGIVMSVSLAFVSIVAIIEGKTLWAALVRSRDLVRGRWMNVFSLFFIFAVFAIISVVATGGQYSPVSFLLTPVMYVFTYLMYKKLVSFNQLTSPSPRGDWYYKVAAGLSVLAIVVGLVFGSIAFAKNWDEFKAGFKDGYEKDKYSEEYDSMDDYDYPDNFYFDQNTDPSILDQIEPSQLQ